MVDIGFL
jgi:hypothetical protein